ncbi:GHKL domain-containing protein [Alloscardovia omnicolens]|uniref:GHKL domain-containing protein n=1 Tax=Alloscardovia omnicolens TaxID=419015 RepID=UPI003A6C090A
MSRWILGICIERFLTTFIRNILFSIIFPDFIHSNPVSYILIICASYGITIGLVSRWITVLFEKISYPYGQENPALCALYIINFLVIYITSNWATGIVEYHFPRLTQTYDEHSFSVLSFTSIMSGLIAVVIFLFQYTTFYIIELRQETALLEALASQRSSQYATMKTTMEVMNEHIHNFKHQLLALQTGDQAEQKTYAQEAEKLIKQYDSVIRTNNEALDIILNQQRIECARENIRFSCMIDDVNLDRVHVVDLYTIMGNALENAREYVTTLDDKDKRVISLTVHQHGNIVVFSCDNYFEGNDKTVTMHNGLPVTTKSPSWSHGIGLKSIRSLALKYGGDMIVNIHDHTFSLKISVRV